MKASNQRTRIRGLVLSIAVLSVISSSSHFTLAQTTTTGQLIGQVTDPTGALVPQAKVELRDTATGAVRTTTTDSAGQYALAQIAPGTYSLTVSAHGFAQTVVPSVTVQVGKTANINVELKVGNATEVVEVRSTPGAELQTMDATVGNTIGGNEIVALPTLERNTTSLLLLQPLSTPQQFSSQSSRFGGQVAGARSDQNSFLLDGGEITNPVSGNSDYYKAFNGGPEGAIPTPVESIQEFNVETNNPSGSQSLSLGGGAQVIMVTRRGGDHYHGSLYYSYNGSVLNANRWDANRLGRPKPNVVNNRFGGSLGGHVLPNQWKSYFFVNYEGRRRNEAVFLTRIVPTACLKQGILRFKDAAGNTVGYSMVPGAPNAACNSAGTGSFDPRGLGMAPPISKLWALEPAGNDISQGDGLNTIGFSGFGKMPHNDNFGLIRADHDFGSRFHWTASYRHYTEAAGILRQADIGGLVSGDVLGTPKILSDIPRQPRFLVTGLTASPTPAFTNDVHVSWLRDWWQWNSLPPFPQVSGTPAALVPGGDTVNALVPVNIDTQGARTRRWNSHGLSVRDDVTWVRGGHIIRLGGSLNHTWADFVRDDGQQNSQKTLQYFIGNTSLGGISFPSSARPPACSASVTTNCLPSSQNSTWNGLYAEVLGMVDGVTILRARDANLGLLPQGTDLSNTVTYKQATLYAQDTWRVRPTLTLTGGLAWAASVPSLPADNGKLIMTVSAADGRALLPRTYLNQRSQAALAGQIFNPVVGFTPFRNMGRDYPWSLVTDNFEPRAALAWQPKFTSGILGRIFGDGKTVLRGGYWRFFDRLNGVQAVIDTLQSVGIGQPLLCQGPGLNAATASDCRGSSGTTPSTAFRIGIDGSTIPLPTIAATLTPPIIPGNTLVSNATIAVVPNSFVQDPQWTPGSHNQWDFTIQRELPGKSRIEVGYVGHTARNIYQGIDLNQVPLFMTAGGQSFARAFDALAADPNLTKSQTSSPVAAQAFFEASLAVNSKFCSGFPSCSAGVASNFASQIANQRVRDVFQGIQSAFRLGPATAAATQISGGLFFWSSLALSNYHAGFASYRIRAYKGLTLDANATYAHSLDNTGVNQDTDQAFTNSYNPDYDYGTSLFDRKFVLTVLGTWELPLHAQTGWLNRVIGGWDVSPIVSVASGLPLRVLDGSGQEFGQTSLGAASEAVRIGSGRTESGIHHVAPASGCGSSASGTGSGLNIFADPQAVCSLFRPIQVSVDRTSRGGTLRGFKPWDVALGVRKKTAVTEHTSVTFGAEFFNLFNHVNFLDPAVSLQSPQTFGVITTQGNDPRVIQLGVRLDF